MIENVSNGWIEVITGCMYAGKTEELLRRLKRLIIAKQQVVVFKPAIDKRYDQVMTVSHLGRKTGAIPVDDAKAIRKYLQEHGKELQAIAVDEVQFFKRDLIPVLESYAKRGKRIIVAGLDRDFRAEPFPVMASLLARAEFVTKLSAICVRCGKPAFYTQRIIAGKPARYSDPIILIGATEAYEARCRRHHQISKR